MDLWSTVVDGPSKTACEKKNASRGGQHFVATANLMLDFLSSDDDLGMRALRGYLAKQNCVQYPRVTSRVQEGGWETSSTLPYFAFCVYNGEAGTIKERGGKKNLNKRKKGQP